MATKSKLEQAVEAQASNLNDAQREIVMSQFKLYKQNRARISEIGDELRASRRAAPVESKAQVARNMALVNEMSQLVNANNGIAANLFDQLSDKESR